MVVLNATDPFTKLKEAMRYIYEKHDGEFDWLFKSNDNSFIILENLRHLLYQYDSNWPMIVGQRFLDEVS
jgi:glycoprotein-N-acetylgalactosamine 3-beta-galactosyltransferase